ncbi:MAG: GNAT family N-acetyltransferase [Actinomycetales bacterium]|nr:GNAT family N-acetyltransferase [Actinomycetales bacterium]
MTLGPGSEHSGEAVRGVLRPLDVDDLDELLDVRAEASLIGLGHIFSQKHNPFPVDRIRERWESELIDPYVDCFAIVDEERTIVGFAATREREFLHFGTAVRTWGSGLASRAHDEVLAHMRSQGLSSAWLRAFEANVRARRFYARRGWLPTGEQSRSAFAPYPILLHYRLNLVDDVPVSGAGKLPEPPG